MSEVEYRKGHSRQEQGALGYESNCREAGVIGQGLGVCILPGEGVCHSGEVDDEGVNGEGRHYVRSHGVK